MDYTIVIDNWPFVAVPALCLMLGWLFGRLGRGKQPAKAAPPPELAQRKREPGGKRAESGHGVLARLAFALPNVVRELTRSDLSPQRVPPLIFSLADAIFEPEQILLYGVARSSGGEATRELKLVAEKGFGQVPPGLRRIPFGQGKIGWVADNMLDMLKDDWRNLAQTERLNVPDNPPLRAGLIGPLLRYSGDKETLVGVLCLGAPRSKPKNEKLMMQLITSLGCLAIINTRNVTTLREQANTDGLTGLLNKRFFMLEVAEIIVNAGRRADQASVFIFDIDHFKTYNDTNGHPAGDDLLRRMGRLLKEHCRPGDLCCRYGGEEFIFAMPNTGAQEAYEVAENMRRIIDAEVFQHQEKQPSGNLTISGGLATFPEHGHSSDELIRHADEALYKSKTGGRNAVTSYRPVEIGDALALDLEGT